MQLPVLCILLLLWPQLLIPAASSSSLAHTHTASSRAAGERKSQPSSFAVQLPGQSETTARDIAARYGFKFIDKVPCVYVCVCVCVCVSLSLYIYTCALAI